MLIEDLTKMHFQIIHLGIESSTRKFSDFVVNDVTVDLAVGYFLIAISVSQNLDNFREFNNGEWFGLILFLVFLINLVQDCLHLCDISEPRLIFILRLEFLDKDILNILRLIVDKH